MPDPFGFASLSSIPAPGSNLNFAGQQDGGAFGAVIQAARSNVVDDPVKLLQGILGNAKTTQDISYVPAEQGRKERELTIRQERHDQDMTLDQALQPYRVASAREGVRAQVLGNDFNRDTYDARKGIVLDDWKRVQDVAEIRGLTQDARQKAAVLQSNTAVVGAQNTFDDLQGRNVLAQFIAHIRSVSPQEAPAAAREFMLQADRAKVPTGVMLAMNEEYRKVAHEDGTRQSLLQDVQMDELSARNFSAEEMAEYQMLQTPGNPTGTSLDKRTAFARIYQKSQERQLDAKSDRRIEEIMNRHNPNSGVKTQQAALVRSIATQVAREEATLASMEKDATKPPTQVDGQRAKVRNLNEQLRRATLAAQSGTEPLPTGDPGSGSPLMPPPPAARPGAKGTTLPTPLQERTGLDTERFNRAVAIKQDVQRGRLTPEEGAAALRALGLK